MGFDLVDVVRSDDHVRITLANEEKPNPINHRLQDELNAVLDDVDGDESIRLLSVTGHGNAFAVGADIHEMNEWVQQGQWDEMAGFLRRGQELMTRISEYPAVTLAAVNGYALGGGLELALACDMRFAARSATFGLPEIDLGMIPGWGGTQRLPHVVGMSTAKDLLVTGRRVDADEAAEIGLVDRVVDDDELETAVDEYADTLADKPAHTIRYVLDAVNTGSGRPDDAELGYELLSDLLSSMSGETATRFEAFIEER